MPSLKTVIDIVFFFLFSLPFQKEKFFIRHTHTHHPLLSSAHLSFGDSAADLGTALTGGETGRIFGDDVRSLLDDLFTLGEDELDVARIGHVGVDLSIEN